MTDAVTAAIGGALVLLVALVAVAVVAFLRRKRAARQQVADVHRQQVADVQQTISALDLRDMATAYALEGKLVRLPSKAQKALTGIKDDLIDLSRIWDDLQASDPGTRMEVEEIAFWQVPRTLELWNNLPADMRGDAHHLGGRSAADVVVAQFESIERGLGEVKDAAYQGTLAELDVAAALATRKYGSGGELDLG